MEPIPSTTWRMISPVPGRTGTTEGLDAFVDKGIGVLGRMIPRQKRLLLKAEGIVAMERGFRHVSDRKLRDRASELHEQFRRGRVSPTDRDTAFALVREVAFRKVGLKPFAVQVAAALSMESGCIAEMATGEGKTLAATMPAVLAGWRGRGCHVVTSNDYLAGRDAALMGAVYEFCGLETACIQQGMPPVERRRAYHAQVTYCSNKEVTADFLRDQIILARLRGLPSAILKKMVDGPRGGLDDLLQRGLAYAIVDEADSVLIDEAVTPLIISGEGPNREGVEAYKTAFGLAGGLEPSDDYRIDRRYREIHLTQAGRKRLAQAGEPLGGLWASARRREELVTQSLMAREFFVRDRHYIIDRKRVSIVDEFTGRLMPDRSWRNGIHQAVEAKEGLEINPPRETYARISFQKFFRLYRRLSGMTGTGAEAQSELWHIYHRPIVPIPTHRPCIRKVLPDRVFISANAKWRSVVQEIRSVHGTGRPILVGTCSVMASQHLSDLLTAEGLDHVVLNATQQDREAQIIAGAGHEGCITVATNMAGRGTDIRLGGGVAGLGGLHVIATERHESRRVDRQLFGRCARQGDPGSAQAFISLEDGLFRQHSRWCSEALRRICGRSRSEEVSSPFVRAVADRAQCRAERVAARQRREVLRTDHWLDEHLGFAARNY